MACALALGGRAQADPVPVPPAPFAQAPLVALPPVRAALPATGPLGRSLDGAYRAIVRAGVSDPAAAQRAQFLYAEARQRALRGDVAGALASAGAAQAAALMQPPAALAPAQAMPPAFGTPARESPLLAAGAQAALSPELLVARNEIELAERVHPESSLAAAKRRYRRALDASLAGDAATERAEARAAFDSAAEVLSRPK